jgi:hypothetical protein
MRLMGKWNWWSPKWLDRILPAKAHPGGLAKEEDESE